MLSLTQHSFLTVGLGWDGLGWSLAEDYLPAYTIGFGRGMTMHSLPAGAGGLTKHSLPRDRDSGSELG